MVHMYHIYLEAVMLEVVREWLISIMRRLRPIEMTFLALTLLIGMKCFGPNEVFYVAKDVIGILAAGIVVFKYVMESGNGVP